MAKRYNIPPGEKLMVSGQIPPDVDPSRVRIEARWRCGGCDRQLYKTVPVIDANGKAFQLACPHCDPDNLAARGVETIAPPRNQLRRWLARFDA